MSRMYLGSFSFNFNPRPPRGGRPVFRLVKLRHKKFQSTPPARGATDAVNITPDTELISIHAPREGGDHSPESRIQLHQEISIHAPREGGDPIIAHRRPKN